MDDEDSDDDAEDEDFVMESADEESSGESDPDGFGEEHGGPDDGMGNQFADLGLTLGLQLDLTASLLSPLTLCSPMICSFKARDCFTANRGIVWWNKA